MSEYFLLGGGLFFFIAITIRNFWIGMFATFLLANFYGQFRNTIDFRNDELPTFYEQKVKIEGTVTNFPDYREKSTRVTFRAKKIKTNDKMDFQPVSGNLLLVTSPDVDLHYGDNLVFSAKLSSPRNFGTFDYQKFLRRFNIQTIAKNPEKIEFLEEAGGNFFLRTAEKMRNFFAKNLENSLPPPHSTIATGILLGIKKELPAFTKNDFKVSGLQHLLVVSGFNVSIVILLVALLLKKFGRRATFLGALIAVGFFVAMTGAEAPVVRAAIMGTVVGLAAASGRFSEARNVFFLTIVIIAFFDPKIAQTDVGFFLSSAATLGIIIGTPLIEKCLSFVPFAELKTILAVTFAAQIAVSPILGIYFGEFPVAGFLSNLLSEPLIPLGMFFAFISSVFGLLSAILAKIIAIPAFVIIEMLLWIAHFFSIFPVFNISKWISFPLAITVGSILLWGSFWKKT